MASPSTSPASASSSTASSASSTPAFPTSTSSSTSKSTSSTTTNASYTFPSTQPSSSSAAASSSYYSFYQQPSQPQPSYTATHPTLPLELYQQRDFVLYPASSGAQHTCPKGYQQQQQKQWDVAWGPGHPAVDEEPHEGMFPPLF